MKTITCKVYVKKSSFTKPTHNKFSNFNVALLIVITAFVIFIAHSKKIQHS